jgi:hypothetical protein
MNRIKKIAIKDSEGKVKTAPIGKRHKDIPSEGQHGFIDSKGKFIGRNEGAKIAKKAGQTKMKSKQLHSSNLDKKNK